MPEDARERMKKEALHISRSPRLSFYAVNDNTNRNFWMTFAMRSTCPKK